MHTFDAKAWNVFYWPKWGCWREWQRNAPAATLMKQHTVEYEKFLPKLRFAQVHLVQRFSRSTVIHGLSYRIVSELTCSNHCWTSLSKGVKTVDRWLLAGLRHTSWKAKRTYTNVWHWKIQLIKWQSLVWRRRFHVWATTFYVWATRIPEQPRLSNHVSWLSPGGTGSIPGLGTIYMAA